MHCTVLALTVAGSKPAAGGSAGGCHSPTALAAERGSFCYEGCFRTAQLPYAACEPCRSTGGVVERRNRRFGGLLCTLVRPKASAKKHAACSRSTHNLL
mmetsp:Transcript_76400/g.181715  ORF Transcript_76400/g.181715 Transcript_76400/m.181715 type:complete len:99 (-) Transcript_76400:1168-1464(-)